ncbi:MAG: hypothetical protein FGM24_02170 [Candidatus Kapabacteria bacterium]|nr:hypothetical protein [Candidatus Kapabacteria bacterium]
MDSDADAIRHLYGESARRYVFRTFKSRFAEDVLSCYLTVEADDPVRSSSAFTRYRLRLYYLAAVVLGWTGRKLLAVRVLQKGLDLALTSDFSDILYLYTSLLSELSRSLDVRSEQSLYSKLMGTYLRRWQSELIVAEAVLRDDIMIRGDRACPLTREDTLQRVRERITTINHELIPFEAQLGYLRIMTRLSAAKGNTVMFRQYAKQTDTLLEEHSQASGEDQAAVAADRALGLVQLRMMQDVLSVDCQHSTDLRPDSSVWFTWHASGIIACVHLGQIDEAVRRWNAADAIHNRHFEARASADTPWRLIGGYIALLETLGLAGSERRDRPFRMSSFVNSLPNPLQQDLRAGLPYLILEIAHAITKDDYDLASRRIEAGNIALVRISHAYEYRRFMMFWQLIRLIYNKRFDVNSIRDAAGPHLQQLSMLAQDPLPSLIAEVIPFEELFEHLLNAMSRNESRNDHYY